MYRKWGKMKALYNFNLVVVQMRLRSLIMTFNWLSVDLFTYWRYMYVEVETKFVLLAKVLFAFSFIIKNSYAVDNSFFFWFFSLVNPACCHHLSRPRGQLKKSEPQPRKSSEGLFTWRWGTPARWGTPPRWGYQSLHTISLYFLIAFTCEVGYLTGAGCPVSQGG